MSDLWLARDCAPWHASLAAYEAAIERRGVRNLVEHDRWVRTELPAVLGHRREATADSGTFITRDELIRVTRWKMARGAWRARNLALVAGNAEAEVERLSREAFAAVPDPRRPIALLAKLAGVGPATASAVLAAGVPDVYPFFDDQVADQIPDLGEVKFTVPYYLRYAERLRDRASALGAGCSHENWTAHLAGQALWAGRASG